MKAVVICNEGVKFLLLYICMFVSLQRIYSLFIGLL